MQQFVQQIYALFVISALFSVVRKVKKKQHNSVSRKGPRKRVAGSPQFCAQISTVVYCSCSSTLNVSSTTQIADLFYTPLLVCVCVCALQWRRFWTAQRSVAAFGGICGLQSFQLPINDSCFSQTGQTFSPSPFWKHRKQEDCCPRVTTLNDYMPNWADFHHSERVRRKRVVGHSHKSICLVTKIDFCRSYINAEMAKEFLWPSKLICAV